MSKRKREKKREREEEINNFRSKKEKREFPGRRRNFRRRWSPVLKWDGYLFERESQEISA